MYLESNRHRWMMSKSSRWKTELNMCSIEPLKASTKATAVLRFIKEYLVDGARQTLPGRKRTLHSESAEEVKHSFLHIGVGLI